MKNKLDVVRHMFYLDNWSLPSICLLFWWVIMIEWPWWRRSPCNNNDKKEICSGNNEIYQTDANRDKIQRVVKAYSSTKILSKWYSSWNFLKYIKQFNRLTATFKKSHGFTKEWFNIYTYPENGCFETQLSHSNLNMFLGRACK